jgi:hypothetical protein
MVMQPSTSTASQLWVGGLSERERRPRFGITTAHSEAGAVDGDAALRIDSATARAAALSRAMGMRTFLTK